jgi:thiosulfate reductase cytochrome b subunit
LETYLWNGLICSLFLYDHFDTMNNCKGTASRITKNWRRTRRSIRKQFTSTTDGLVWQKILYISILFVFMGEIDKKNSRTR